MRAKVDSKSWAPSILCDWPRARGFLILLVFWLFQNSAPAQNILAWGANGAGQCDVPAAATNIVAAAAGGSFSLALRSDGSLVGWGALPAIPTDLTNVVGVAAGVAHCLALKMDGSVVAWGNNSQNQLAVPATATNVIALAAGYKHSLALRSDGSVVAWGRNTFGQCDVPAGATNAIGIAAGEEQSLAILDDGSIMVWGGNPTGPASAARQPFPGIKRDVVAISAGSSHNLAIRAGGRVTAWGSTRFAVTKVPKGLTNVVALEGGTNYSLALLADGTLRAWGSSSVTNLPANATNLLAICAGPFHALAITGGAPLLLGGGHYASRAGIGLPLPLYVRAVGTSYQWYRNGSLITGADGAYPKIPAQLGADNAIFQVVVSNPSGVVTGLVGSVSVGPIADWGDAAWGQVNLPTNLTNPISLYAGGFHGMGLNADGSVTAWGKNAFGQCTIPAQATNIVTITAGNDHSVALRQDGTVIGWGRNDYGQVDVPSFATNVVALSAGWGHTVGLRADGTVLAWGNDDYGQTDVSFLATEVVALAAGYYHNIALRADGSVVTWGWDTPTPAAATNIVAVAAGWEHCLALRGDGTVVAWGDNTYGQSTVPSAATNIVAISAGYYHNLAWSADGRFFSWGRNNLGVTDGPTALTNVASLAAGEDFSLAFVDNGPPRFGLSLNSIEVPAGSLLVLPGIVSGAGLLSFQWYVDGVPIPGATNHNLILRNARTTGSSSYSLVAGNAYGFATNSAATVIIGTTPATIRTVGGWGDNLSAQSAVPARVADPRAIAAGAYHSLVLNGDGSVTAWGKNTSGQTNVPAGLSNVIAIAAGSEHSLALSQDGRVTGWGKNWDGQTNVPPQATNVVAIKAGWAHSVVLRGDGSVVAWGNNDVDQTNVPALLTNITGIACGYYHTLALRSDHKLISWGLYDSVPASATNVVGMAAGAAHSLAVRADGTVVAWGDNTFGQSTVPDAATNVVAVSAGYFHSVALRSDGTVVAWGKTNLGVVTLPQGLGNIISLSAGEGHTLALRQQGPVQTGDLPATLNVHVGESCLISTAAAGSQPLSLQWSLDGVPISGATNPVFWLASAQSSDEGVYRLGGSNAVSAISSSGMALIVLRDPFVIADSPGTSALFGQPLCLNPQIVGEPPFAFQWLKDGVPLADTARLSGTLSSNLCVTQLDFTDAGNYRLVVNNSHGAFTGLVTHLSISPIIGWGDNYSHQLDVPPDTGNVISLAGGDGHTLALRPDGSVVAWGDNTFGQASVPAAASNIVAIAAYADLSMALTAEGTVLEWGRSSLALTNPPPNATNLVMISTSDTHSMGVRPDQSVVSWGTGTGLVNGTVNAVSASAGAGYSLLLQASGNVVPVGFSGFPAVADGRAVAAGSKFRVALRGNGQFAGYYASGQGGSSATISGGTNLAAVAVSAGNVVTLQSNGVPVVWYDNTYGQSNAPPTATNLVAIAAGSTHLLGLLGASRSALSSQSSARTVMLGDTVTLLARSVGNAAVSYQWQLNGTNLSGATSAALFLSAARWTNAGLYRVIISDAFGSTAGPAITLNVQPPAIRFDAASVAYSASSNSFVARVLGGSGTAPIVLYTSTNLIDWIPANTNPPVHGPVSVVLPIAPNVPRTFLRAAEIY